MAKLLVFSKDRVTDLFVVVWAISVSLVTLSQGAGSFNYSRLTYVVVFLPICFFIFIKIRFLNSNRKKISLFFLILFLMGGFLSSAYHGDMAMVFSLFSFAMLLVVGLYFYPAVFNGERQLLFFNLVFGFSLAYFVFFSLQHGLVMKTTLHYENKNTLGMASATVAILGLGLIFSAIEKCSKFHLKAFYCSGVLFMSYLTILTVSRAASLSIFIVALVLGVVYFLRNDTRSRLKFALVVILIGLLFLYQFGDLVLETIVEKFDRKEGDVFDGRSTLWQFILAHTGFLGLGMDFFRHEAVIAAHSTYFSFLGRYGWVLFVPFIVLLLYLAWDLFYTLAFKRGDSIGFIHSALFFGFLLMSVTEIMIFKSIMVYAFLFLGDHNRLSTKCFSPYYRYRRG